MVKSPCFQDPQMGNFFFLWAGVMMGPYTIYSPGGWMGEVGTNKH